MIYLYQVANLKNVKKQMFGQERNFDEQQNPKLFYNCSKPDISTKITYFLTKAKNTTAALLQNLVY
ncbi:hypothetical protein H839_10548 [Parageobacillus genomosp. 1]|uniref:Uncharacterized protein n=1 Tax=Parageobacillus genomosp. 1 TaxID=1295642 RepID=A0ABC9VF35_9BACL|nr:hypothetical protein H839_10548 [Parageobacillus genomosp. 1]